MSGQTPSTKAVNKNDYGPTKIERIAAEKAARREEHEEDCLAHDRRTEDTRRTFKWYAEKRSRLEKIHHEAEVSLQSIDAQKAKAHEVMRQQTAELRKHEEQHGAKAKIGEKDAETSAKYKAYLEMKSDELNL